MLIRAGALHRANGGAILIDARGLLAEPFSWPALKRALTRSEGPDRGPGALPRPCHDRDGLEPDPIPLDVKVVLFGERILYYLLASLDPDFATLFKVLADSRTTRRAPRRPRRRWRG